MAEVQPQPAEEAPAAGEAPAIGAEPAADGEGPGTAAEAPAAPAAKEETASADSGVGVLGWLGFVIINIAAWGIIAVSSALAWPLGFTIALVYTGVLIGIATCLQRWGTRYQSFQNLLWVMACWFVFILGLYLSINVVGPAFDEQPENPLNPGGGSLAPDNDLTKLLPAGSSTALRAWADGSASSDWREAQVPNYAEFEGYVFFSGMSSSHLASSSSDAILLRSDAASTSAVAPVLTNARSFVELQSKLFFLANSENREQGLWSISQSGASQGAATLTKGVSSANGNYASVSDLIVDGGSLYFKASYSCGDYWYESIYSSDGTTAGTVNLRGDSCAVESNRTGTDEPDYVDTTGGKPTAQMWGVLLLGVVPMVALASVIVVWKKMPGMFMNIFLGVGIGVILLYFIGLDEDGVEFDNVSNFLKWFITLYTGVAYVATTLVSILIRSLPALIEDMKDWIVVIVGLPFFIIIHFDLEIPVTEAAWAWLLYIFLAGMQMLISIAVARTFPMVMGAISTFVISWKIAREIVKAIFGPDLGEVEVLTLLGIMALQGIGIIAGAIMYATKRAEIEALVQGALLRCLKRDQDQVMRASASE